MRNMKETLIQDGIESTVTWHKFNAEDKWTFPPAEDAFMVHIKKGKFVQERIVIAYWRDNKNYEHLPVHREHLFLDEYNNDITALVDYWMADIINP